MALDVDRFTDALLEGTKALIAKEVEPLKARIAELEAERVAFKGVWEASKQLRRGDLITHSGSLWFVTRDTTGEKPGESHAFQLALKQGSAR